MNTKFVEIKDAIYSCGHSAPNGYVKEGCEHQYRDYWLEVDCPECGGIDEEDE